LESARTRTARGFNRVPGLETGIAVEDIGDGDAALRAVVDEAFGPSTEPPMADR
jgi:hypothetical protein